eukprot:s1677_g6.t1
MATKALATLLADQRCCRLSASGSGFATGYPGGFGHFPPASSNPNLHPVFGTLAFSQLCKLTLPQVQSI